MTTKHVKFAQVKTAESDNPNGEFEAVLSMATKDRDGEVIESGAFDPLPDHITIDVDHGLSASTTVGSGTPFYDEDGSLKIRGTFASRPLAQEIRSLVAEGHVRHMSVAFMGSEKEKKDGTPHITKAELLNAAFVAVPSNREAVVLSAKGLEEKAGARNSATDAGLIQEMHDMSISLGAVCSTKHVHLPADDAAGSPDPDQGDESTVDVTSEDTADAASPDATPIADEVPGEVKAALEARRNSVALL
jgi:HK97 family phage prohead protease